jgi:hypothetical protein
VDLPEPTAFTAVRYYALLLPVPVGGGELNYPAPSRDGGLASGT